MKKIGYFTILLVMFCMPFFVSAKAYFELKAELKNQLSEDDPKQRFLDIALNKNLKIKHRGNNLEDF